MSKKILYGIMITVLALSMVLVFSGCTKTIKLEDYVQIDVTGVNGYGKASVSVDWDKIQMDFGEKIEKTDSASFYFSEYGEYTLSEAVQESVTYELSAYDKISNGDVITLKWEPGLVKFLSAYDVELIYDEIEYTVEGLEEVTTFDAFSSVDVSFKGISPYGYAEITVSDTSEFDSNDFLIDKSSNFANGDILKITIREDSIIEHIENYGTAPAESEKIFTVSGLESYASKTDDINSESLDKMKAQAVDVHNSKIANWVSPETCKGIDFMGTYLLNAKSPDNVSVKNTLYLVYKINVETEAESFSYYWYIKFDNVTVLPDGTATIDYQNYEVPRASAFFSLSGEGFIRNDLVYEGYEKLDDLYNNCVTKKIAQYVCESTIK